MPLYSYLKQQHRIAAAKTKGIVIASFTSVSPSADAVIQIAFRICFFVPIV